MSKLTSIVLFCTALIATADAQTPDRVWLEPQRPTSTQSDWYPRAIQTLSGRVIDFDANQLRVMVSGDEAETIVAAARVIWIEPGDVSGQQAELIKLFAEQQYAESLAKLPGVLQQRPPVWQQQWLTMIAANAAWKCSRAKIALELVSQLDARPLPPLAIAWLPIAWKTDTQTADATEAALSRLEDPSAATRLIAASWLLSSRHRGEATLVLKQLAAGEDRPEIASLAQCLAWRVAAPPQVIESSSAWEAQLDQLPMVWQVGPTITLSHKLQSAGMADAAKRLQWSLELTPIHHHPALQN